MLRDPLPIRKRLQFLSKRTKARSGFPTSSIRMAELPPEPNTGRKEDDYENIHAGTVIFDKFHRMLLVLQENGRWSLPKGSIKYGESIFLSHFKLNMLTVSFIRNSNNYIRNHKLNYKLTKSQQAMLESLKEPLFIPLDHSNHRGGYKTRRRRVRGTRRGKRRM